MCIFKYVSWQQDSFFFFFWVDHRDFLKEWVKTNPTAPNVIYSLRGKREVIGGVFSELIDREQGTAMNNSAPPVIDG